MKLKNNVTWTIAVIILSAAVYLFLINYWSLGAAVVIVGLGSFILQGLRRIEEDPPHKGILTVLGERKYRKDKEGKKVTAHLDEGWRFMPFYPFVFGYVPVNVERKPFDIEVTTRTPDRAQVKITISVTLRPLPDYLIQYEDSGGFEGVKQHLGGEIEERVREWAEGLQEGPMDWREIYQAKLEAASILIKRVAGNGLFSIPTPLQEIPTYILFRYYSIPRVDNVKKVTKNEKPWVKNKWQKVKDIIEDVLKNKKKELAEEEINTEEDIKRVVKKREKQVRDIRSGEGKTDIADLGMRLERLNISNVEVIGEAGKAADQQAKEQEELEAEKVEINHILKRIKSLKKAGYGLEQALEVLQTERDKITKNVNETKLNISAETRELLKGLGDETLEAIFQKKGGK